MAWYDSLIAAGAVPTGTTKKVIPVGGQTPGYHARDPVSRLLRTMEAAKLKTEAKQEKAQKDMDKKLDIYKTLRSQGYNPAKAYEAAMEGVLPIEAPGETLEEQKQEAGIAKTKAETEKLKKGLKTRTKKELESEILDKVAQGKLLTAGEQKIYDDVLKKQKRAGADDESIDDILNEKRDKETEAPGNMVAVFAPDGQPGFVPKSKLAQALKMGFRRRTITP